MTPVESVVYPVAVLVAGALMLLASHPAMPRYVYELPGRLGRRIARTVRRWAR